MILSLKNLTIACTLLLLALQFGLPVIEARKYKLCDLVKELLMKHRFDRTFLSNWICMIQNESNFDTSLITNKWDGSKSYGLFQIGNRRFCGESSKGGLCQKKCSDFADERIDDDVECAKLIFKSEGFKYWSGWQKGCRGDISKLPNLRALCGKIFAI